MEFRLTIFILLPLGLAAYALLRYALLPAWKRTVERCENLDAREAEGRARREEAERELRGDAKE